MAGMTDASDDAVAVPVSAPALAATPALATAGESTAGESTPAQLTPGGSFVYRHPWALVGTLLALSVSLTHYAADRSFSDFDVYYQAAVRVLNGNGIYDNPPDRLPFTYPPYAAYIMAPLGLLRDVTAAAVFTGISMLCLGRASQLMVRAALPEIPPRANVLAAAVVPGAFLAAEPGSFTLALGQINFILLWLVCEDALGRPVLPRGILTGLAAAIKLTPLVFVVGWLFGRRFKAAHYAVLTFAAAAVIGYVINPTGASAFWGRHVRDVGRVGVIQYAHNQSYNGTLWRILGEGGHPILWWILSGVTGLVALMLAQHFLVRQDDLAMVAVMGVTSALVSPIAWGHHWVWAYPAVVWLAGAMWRGRRHPLLLLLAGPVFWGNLVHTMPQSNNVEFTGPLPVRILESPYVYWGLAFLIALLVTHRPWHRPLLRDEAGTSPSQSIHTHSPPAAPRPQSARHPFE